MNDQAHGLGWSYGRWRKIFARLDKDGIILRVWRLAKSHPRDDEKRLARRVVAQAARHSAMVGVASASPALFPGIGTAVSVVGIVPEEIYLVRRKCEMLLQIATIYGFDPREEERLYEIVALAGTPSRAIEALMTAKEDIKRMAARAALTLGRGTGRASLLGLKTVSRRAVRRLPALGFLVGGGINFITVRALGSKALRFYARLQAGRDREES
jgi:hypothetical protein